MDPHLVRRLQLGCLVLTAALTALLAAGVPSGAAANLLSNIGQSVAPAFAALSFQAASRRLADSPGEARALRLLGASAASWAAGQVVWTVYDASGIAAPFPSFADIGYLMAVPLALMGVWSLSPRLAGTSRLVAGLDGLIVASSLLLVSWAFVLGPSWNEGGDSVFKFMLSLAYPVGNLVVGASLVLVYMRVGRQAGNIALRPIVAGMALLIAADSVFVFTALQGTETDLSFADLGWVCGYLVLALGALRYPVPAIQAPEATATDSSLRRALLPFAVAFMALTTRAILALTGYPTDPFLTVLTVTVALIAGARHILTVRENQELTRELEQNIKELTAREGELSHQALHDPLTGLANRRLFADRVEHALTRGRRSGDLSAVLFVDLDDFKTVNDSLGHAAGDQLLAAVGARLCGCVRPGDTVARLGGDEFGILLEGFETSDHPATIADRMLATLDLPFPLAGRQVYTRASIGIATSHPLSDNRGEELLADADVALYAAKEAGKAGYRHFERVMRVSAVERLELGQDLRDAVGSNQLRCDYQPIVDLVSGRIVALEALVRWHHPTRGLLNPDVFITLAEETGHIGAVGRHVLEQAIGQLARWRSAGEIPDDIEMHVNLSGRQLEDDLLVGQVDGIIRDAGLPPRLVVLEITESVAVDVGTKFLPRLEELRDLGLRLAIDDFGTGYSSLNYLRALPVDVLKIDRAFAQTTDGRTDTVLLEAIVRLGHSLDIEMIAEGIEMEEQAVALRRLGCRRAQGYHFYRPIPMSLVPDRIRESMLDDGPAPDPARR